MAIKINMCSIDRILRIVGSVALIYVGFVEPDVIGNPIVNVLLGGFGVLNLISSAVGFCPVYHLAQISTVQQAK